MPTIVQLSPYPLQTTLEGFANQKQKINMSNQQLVAHKTFKRYFKRFLWLHLGCQIQPSQNNFNQSLSQTRLACICMPMNVDPIEKKISSNFGYVSFHFIVKDGVRTSFSKSPTFELQESPMFYQVKIASRNCETL